MFGTQVGSPTYEYNISSVESQKGAITIQRCSVENQKGAIAIDCTVIVPFRLSTDDILGEIVFFKVIMLARKNIHNQINVWFHFV